MQSPSLAWGANRRRGARDRHCLHLDICVLTEKTIPRGDILLRAIPLGGLRTIDSNTADDKIIAVMQHDAMYGEWRNITDCSPALLERLKHYFLTYKDAPHVPARKCEITHIYDRQETYEVIRRSQVDYRSPTRSRQ